MPKQVVQHFSQTYISIVTGYCLDHYFTYCFIHEPITNSVWTAVGLHVATKKITLRLLQEHNLVSKF